MSKLFIHIYNYLERHLAVRYLLLVGSSLLLLFFAVQVKFEEDVTRFSLIRRMPGIRRLYSKT